MRRAWARRAAPLLLGAAVLGLVLVSLRSRPPAVPADRDHPPGMVPERCLDCHGPGRAQARPPRHPQSDRCQDCHAAAPPAGGG